MVIRGCRFWLDFLGVRTRYHIAIHFLYMKIPFFPHFPPSCMPIPVINGRINFLMVIVESVSTQRWIEYSMSQFRRRTSDQTHQANAATVHFIQILLPYIAKTSMSLVLIGWACYFLASQPIGAGVPSGLGWLLLVELYKSGNHVIDHKFLFQICD